MEPEAHSYSRWEHLPSPVADKIFNALNPRQSSAARLVCQYWRQQLSSTRRALRPSSARLPRGWSVRLPSLKALDMSSCPQIGLNRVIDEASGVKELVAPRDLTDKGLPALGQLASLISLDLAGCDRLTGETLPALLSCTALKTLDISGCKRLTSDAVAPLAGLTSVTSLHLSRCERLSNTAMRTLVPAMPGLTSLAAARCPQVL